MAKVIFWLQLKIVYTNSNYMQENVFDIQNKKYTMKLIFTTTKQKWSYYWKVLRDNYSFYHIIIYWLYDLWIWKPENVLMWEGAWGQCPKIDKVSTALTVDHSREFLSYVSREFSSDWSFCFCLQNCRVPINYSDLHFFFVNN